MGEAEKQCKWGTKYKWNAQGGEGELLITFALFVCAREGGKKENSVSWISGSDAQPVWNERANTFPWTIPLSSSLIRDQTHAAILYLNGKKKKALIWKFAYSPTKLISLFSVSTKAKYIARSNAKCMGFLQKCINCDWEFSFVTEGDVLKIRLTFLKDLFTLVYMHPHPIYLLFFSSYSYFSFLLSKYSYYTRLY